jgi:hypothetical protein
VVSDSSCLTQATRGQFFIWGALIVNFNENSTSSLTMTGTSVNSTGLSITALTDGTSINTTTKLDALDTIMNNASTTLRTQSSELSTNLSILTTRQDKTRLYDKHD